ncbi:thiamine phosphate synthase [Novosphingopyxis sp.]|uniref:thiamine phosphate synthase n=1 Tax=Novosphingopyxis sp. TaxID=2709690 RepID=UPI003B5B93FF
MAKGKASRGKAPCIWLMTDPRLGESLYASARALPRGSAIVLRHHDLDPIARRILFRRLRRIAKQRGHRLFLADDAKTARRWQADGVHGRTGAREPGEAFPRSAPVHGRRELRDAVRSGADWLLVSPVFPTRTHPGRKPLGAAGFRQLAGQAALFGNVVALGGMRRARYAMMRALPVTGWAAIDSLTK